MLTPAANNAHLRWSKTTVAVLVLLVVSVIAAVAVAAMKDPEPKFCTADARLGPDGRMYVRDLDRGCKFVDDLGNLMPGQSGLE